VRRIGGLEPVLRRLEASRMLEVSGGCDYQSKLHREVEIFDRRVLRNGELTFLISNVNGISSAFC
jgi:hypothetical protein